jgi:hypothetical protein
MGFWPDRADDPDFAEKEICPVEAETISSIPWIGHGISPKREM